MSSDFLSPDTSMALMKAAQSEQSKAHKTLKDQTRTPGNIDEIERAASEFEAVFMTEMLKPMFEGIEVEEPFGGGKGEEVFRSFLLQEYGKVIAQTGQIGVADHVKQELINIQEQANNEALSSE